MDDLRDPKHWYLVVGEGPYQVRNVTIGQTLLPLYDTKDKANDAIKQIAFQNPTFKGNTI